MRYLTLLKHNLDQSPCARIGESMRDACERKSPGCDMMRRKLKGCIRVNSNYDWMKFWTEKAQVRKHAQKGPGRPVRI
jgi:hypothetical protein